MKIGAWIHTGGDVPLDEQIASAADNGLTTIRCYHLGYGQQAAAALKQTGISLLAGMHVNAEALVEDWRSQVQLDELAHYHDLGVPLEAICVGNELREGGDHPDSKRFTARLAFGLANVLDTYRRWLDEHGFFTPLTYAMEGIVFDAHGRFNEWVWPLIDACDVVSLNSYPMDGAGWFTFGAFEESRLLLQDRRVQHERFAKFDLDLRRAVQQLARVDKPVFLSETGFPSAVGYHTEGDLIVPEHDTASYGAAMRAFVDLIRQINADYDDRIRAIYIYEWRDNLYHSKIANVEQSPIHVAFGWCDRAGTPKFPIRDLAESG